jgi:hypothetical protein
MARQTSTIHNKTANNCVTSNDGFWREAAIHQRIASDQIGDGGRPMYS